LEKRPIGPNVYKKKKRERERERERGWEVAGRRECIAFVADSRMRGEEGEEKKARRREEQ
jgi:hypothetical protein